MIEDIEGARVHLTLARTVLDLVPRDAEVPYADQVAELKRRLEAEHGDDPMSWRRELMVTLAKVRRIKAEPGSKDADDLAKTGEQVTEALRAVGGDPAHVEHVPDES